MTNDESLGYRKMLPSSKSRQRFPLEATGIDNRKSRIYIDIEAIIDGDKLHVGSVIPEQYSLKKLWEDVKDACYDQLIRHATGVRIQIMLPWESRNMTLTVDSELQEAFKKLRDKNYSWAMFIIAAEMGREAVISNKTTADVVEDSFDSIITPDEQFLVSSNLETEFDCVQFASIDELPTTETTKEIVPDLNDEGTTDGIDEEDITAYIEWDGGLDDYQSGDDSEADSDGDSNVEAHAACCRYEAHSGGVEFSDNGLDIVLRPGQLFKDVDEFRRVVRLVAIKNGFKLARIKNEKSRATFQCAAPGCTWRIHASPNWNKRHFQIKTHCSEHCCTRNKDNYEATSTWIAVTFLHLFKANTDISIEVIASELLRRYNISCGNQRLYRAKNKALEILGADHKACYSKLFRYMHAIINSNPGSTVSLEKDWSGSSQCPIFKRMFIFFDANRRGFIEGCRNFIGVDGCHLKGLYKGVLLSAVGLDANYGIYPLAVCVVESENREFWVYFMEKLYEQIGSNGGEGLCFMSDRQKGILSALERVFPQSLKRYCCRHIYSNFKQKFPGLLLKNSFWRACRSSNSTDFNNHMSELYGISPAAHHWLMQIPIVCWAKHCFPSHTKCSHVTNNMTESFNNWINNFRHMPILRMLEEIRRKIMMLIHKRNEQSVTCQDELPPFVRRKVMERRIDSRSLSVIFGHNDTFEVLVDASMRTVVDLGRRHCDCGEWDISGLPCKHAICCIDAMRYNVNDYVHPLLKNEAFKKTYKHQLHPVPDESKWPLVLHDNLQPPLVVRAAGRPQTKRKREDGEAKAFKRSSSVRCSNCDEWGHNVRTCKSDRRYGKQKRRMKGNANQAGVASLASECNVSQTTDGAFITQNIAHDDGL